MTTPEIAKSYVDLLEENNQPVDFKVYPGKSHGFLDSGCNDYNNGCFKELAYPAVTDLVAFLKKHLQE